MRNFRIKQLISSAFACSTLMLGAFASAYDRTVIECSSADACIRIVPGHVSGLEGFDIQLASDDRHISRIDWHPHAFRDELSTEYLMRVVDENAGDDFPRDFHAIDLASSTSLYNLTGIARREFVSGGPCAGACRLPVNVAADETFVLTGFSLDYLEDDARDHHVRRIAVLPGRDGDGAFVMVEISDDNGNRPISVAVHYLAAQSEYLDGPYAADSGQRGVPSGFNVAREPGPAVLRGFSVNYPVGEEDHHFKRLMIDLSDDRVRAAFHDNDESRVFEHFVHYSILRDAPEEESSDEVYLGPGATGSTVGGVDLDRPLSRVCYDAVQDRIAWNYSGNRRWSDVNINSLCEGNESSSEPAQCFERVMHGDVEHGAGARWRWQDALELCAGAVNHRLTVGCFELRQRRGDTQSEAINACKRE